MTFLTYTYACAGISYLSNLLLIIMIDMAKHKWMFNERQIRHMRNWVHVVVGLLNCAIITYFIATFFININK